MSSSFPNPLTEQEEQYYVKLLEKNDPDARLVLIERNLRLVAHIAKKYAGPMTSQDDLISIGTIGLIKAVNTYTSKKSTRLATYAAKCIQNEVLMFFRSQKKQAGEVSINETIDMDRDGNPLTYIDVISCDDSVVEEVDLKMQTDRMLCYINTVLSPRERQIIIMRYGLYGGQQYTQHETAERLGISRSYVSRIEKGALDKLFAAFTGENR